MAFLHQYHQVPSPRSPPSPRAGRYLARWVIDLSLAGLKSEMPYLAENSTMWNFRYLLFDRLRVLHDPFGTFLFCATRPASILWARLKGYLHSSVPPLIFRRHAAGGFSSDSKSPSISSQGLSYGSGWRRARSRIGYHLSVGLVFLALLCTIAVIVSGITREENE